MHPLEGERQSVGKELIDELLSRICRIPKQVVESDETAALATLEERLQGHIFGQNEAIAQVVNAVKFSKAGLLDEGKPWPACSLWAPPVWERRRLPGALPRNWGYLLSALT